METTIGVFSSRDLAEQAVKELLSQKVPKESIVFLTRSETEAKSVGKGLGATVGGFMGAATGMSAGVLAASLLVVPGLGKYSHWESALPRFWDWRVPARVQLSEARLPTITLLRCQPAMTKAQRMLCFSAKY
ncbi:MAG: hypothetical protein WBW53_20555 [Terriglobales bacterium]